MEIGYCGERKKRIEGQDGEGIFVVLIKEYSFFFFFPLWAVFNVSLKFIWMKIKRSSAGEFVLASPSVMNMAISKR